MVTEFQHWIHLPGSDAAVSWGDVQSLVADVGYMSSGVSGLFEVFIVSVLISVCIVHYCQISGLYQVLLYDLCASL